MASPSVRLSYSSLREAIIAFYRTGAEYDARGIQLGGGTGSSEATPMEVGGAFTHGGGKDSKGKKGGKGKYKGDKGKKGKDTGKVWRNNMKGQDGASAQRFEGEC
eukprot:773839-Lingulodinium_polyedra.AAC.1